MRILKEKNCGVERENCGVHILTFIIMNSFIALSLSAVLCKCLSYFIYLFDSDHEGPYAIQHI